MNEAAIAKLQEQADAARARIDRHGFTVIAVGAAGDGTPGYAYTVGLSSGFSHPEIFLVGFEPDLSIRLLNNAAELVKEGSSLSSPCLAPKVVEGYNVAFRPARRSTAVPRTGFGRALLGGAFDAVQMFLPDPEGLFPWDGGCDRAFAEVQRGLLEWKGDPPGRARGERKP